MRDDAESRQDHDVDFRVTEEPEQVLEHHRIATASRVEELRAKIAVGQQHGQRAGEHGQGEQQQHRGDQDRPGKERHLVQGHPRRAHVEDGHDIVDRAQDGGDAGRMQRQDEQVHRRPVMACRTRQGWIEHPTAAKAVIGAVARNEHGQHQQEEGDTGQPQRDIVHPREGHVRRADHQRHEIVAETPDQRRHDHEEDHDQAVIGDHDIVEVLGVLDVAADKLGQHTDARLGQFPADQARQAIADNAGNQREDQIEHADVFVVGRIEPTHEKARLLIVAMIGAVECDFIHGHDQCPSIVLISAKRTASSSSAASTIWTAPSKFPLSISADQRA